MPEILAAFPAPASLPTACRSSARRRLGRRRARHLRAALRASLSVEQRPGPRCDNKRGLRMSPFAASIAGRRFLPLRLLRIPSAPASTGHLPACDTDASIEAVRRRRRRVPTTPPSGRAQGFRSTSPRPPSSSQCVARRADDGVLPRRGSRSRAAPDPCCRLRPCMPRGLRCSPVQSPRRRSCIRKRR